MNNMDMYLERIARALETQNLLTLINSGVLTKEEEAELINKVRMNSGLRPVYSSNVETLSADLDEPIKR